MTMNVTRQVPTVQLRYNCVFQLFKYKYLNYKIHIDN